MSMSVIMKRIRLLLTYYFLIVSLTFIFPLSSISHGYAATTTALGTKFVEIRVIDSHGKYTPNSYYTATELVSLVSSIHQAVGSFNLVDIMEVAGNKGTPDPAATGFSDWSGTLDSFVTALKSASGGEILPEADLDVYFGANDVCSNPQPTVPACPPCPSCFFNDAASLLQFSAIAGGQRYLVLDSWAPGAFYTALHPDQTFIQQFFGNLTSQGWRGFIVATSPAKSTTNFAAYDYGNAQYARIGMAFDPSSPSFFYVNEPYINSMQSQEPYLMGHTLAVIESQILRQNSGIGHFINDLNSAQEITALTDLATNQQSGNYVFVYPVLVNQGPLSNYGGPVWDANKALQPNGQSFLNLISSLMNQYNSNSITSSSIVTTTSTGSVVASSRVTSQLTGNPIPGFTVESILLGILVATLIFAYRRRQR